MTDIGFTIAHAAHRPERVETLRQVMAALEGQPVHVESAPGKPREWSERQWRAGLALDTRWVCCLNDDILPCADFVATLRNVVAAQPGSIIDLRNSHGLAREADKRGLRWITSVEGLLGQGYVLPAGVLRNFLQWREEALVPGAADVLSEDRLLNLYAMQHEGLVWHCVPALCDHSTSVPSLYGNENDGVRRPVVLPREGMAGLDWNTDALHAGKLFLGNHYSLLTHLKGPHTAHRLDRYYAIAGGRA